MGSKTVFQVDRAGMLVGITQADESPLEPGVFHIPAGCVLPQPPAEWPATHWPRWNGAGWQLVTKPKMPGADGVLARVKSFFASILGGV